MYYMSVVGQRHSGLALRSVLACPVRIRQWHGLGSESQHGSTPAIAVTQTMASCRDSCCQRAAGSSCRQHLHARHRHTSDGASATSDASAAAPAHSPWQATFNACPSMTTCARFAPHSRQRSTEQQLTCLHDHTACRGFSTLAITTNYKRLRNAGAAVLVRR